jgi:serine/threonine protein kinase
MSFKGGGTPLYMAPEAWDFSKNTIQMDIYSMGIVFYELAALQYPYTPLPNTLEECRSTHLYSSITSLSKINPHLPPSLASVINRMLEKSVKSRFSTWDEIIKLLDAQIAPNSPVDQIVARAVAAKNAEDIARQQREATFKQQKKEKEDFLRLVYSQFEQTIIAPIIEFAEKVNLQYAGKDKLTFSANQYVAPDQTTFFWKLIIPPNNSVTINLEVIRKENFIREVYVERVFNENRTRKENYIPQYKGKNILAWGEITNKSGYGFNIILLDNGDIYGDWIIMNNKNNFSHISGKERREPFAFSLQELPTEIDKVQITHLYSADFNEFSETSFLKLIQTLSFDLV